MKAFWLDERSRLDICVLYITGQITQLRYNANRSLVQSFKRKHLGLAD